VRRFSVELRLNQPMLFNKKARQGAEKRALEATVSTHQPKGQQITDHKRDQNLQVCS
jgi:hypothetical protein